MAEDPEDLPEDEDEDEPDDAWDEMDEEDWDSLPDTEFQQWLEREHACYDARKWVHDKTLEQAWAECTYVEWMRWFVYQVGLAQCNCQPAWRHTPECAYEKMILISTSQGMRERYGNPHFEGPDKLVFVGGKA